MVFKLIGHPSNQKGFTIMELLVASAIFMTVIAAGSSFFNNLNRSSAVNEEMADMQQDIRIAMLTIVRDISIAGYGVETGTGCTTGIAPTNSSTGPDSITIASMGNIAGTLGVAAGSGATILTIAPLVTGTISLNAIQETSATDNGDGTVTINPPITNMTPTDSYPVGTPVLTRDCVVYSVNTANRQLSRSVNGVASVLAEGVLDMQFAYGLDTNGDGLIDDSNGSSVFDTGDFVNIPALPATNDDIRLVRVSLFIQTGNANNRYINGAPVTLEDHDPTTDGGYDLANYQPFRSRVLTRIVRPRNMGL